MNKKRHSLFKRRSLIAFTIVAACLSLTCQTGHMPKIDYTPQKATIVRESAVPTLEAARKKSGQADVHAALGANAVERAMTSGQAVRQGNQALLAEVNRLSSMNSVYANDLKGLVAQLQAQERHTDRVLADMTAARDSLAAERAIRQQIQDKLVLAQQLVSGRDNEAERLREQLDHAQKEAQSKTNLANESAASAQEQAARANTLDGQSKTKSKILWWVGGFALLEALIIIALVRYGRPTVTLFSSHVKNQKTTQLPS